MTEIKILFDSSFLQLRSIEDAEKGITPYFYKHVKLYDGKIVAVLPYRYTGYPLSFNKEFLLMNEMRPAWDLDNLTPASLTGGIEKGSNAVATAAKELFEEAGYTIEEDKLEYLGETFVAKAADTIAYLFAVDVTELAPTMIKGDGSKLEELSCPVWKKQSELKDCKDPLVAQMFMRFSDR